MENTDKMVLSDETVGKDYQIPELVDLNGIGEVMGYPAPCNNGSGNSTFCNTGTSGPAGPN